MHSIIAVNDNKQYLECIKYGYKMWITLGYTPIIIYISETNDNVLPEELMPMKQNVIIFKNPIGYPSSLVAQTIRLFYPAILFKDDPVKRSSEFIVMSDADIVPLSIKIFKELIPTKNKSKAYSFDLNWHKRFKQYPMCYFVATPDMYSKMFFNIKTIEDIHKLYETNSQLKNAGKIHGGKHGGSKAWFCDQTMLTHSFDALKPIEKEHIGLEDKYGMRRNDPTFGHLDTPNYESEFKNEKTLDTHIAPWNIKTRGKTIEIMNKIEKLINGV